MRRLLLVALLVLAVLALAATVYAGVSFIRAGTVTAAGLQQGFNWKWMPMMRGWLQGDSQQYNCPGAGSGSYYYGPGMMNGWSSKRGTGMMGRLFSGNPSGNSNGSCPYAGATSPDSSKGERLTMDQVAEKAKSYIAGNNDLTVSEIMEFDNNFYAVVLEKNTGRGAMELLVDPYSGTVTPEMGPGMMWNLKYGPMGKLFGDSQEISMEKAAQLAQQTLDSQVAGAKVESDGIAFYGYYTFDYSIDGKIAGMLSVNSVTQQTWVHTWHGAFIGEIELVD